MGNGEKNTTVERVRVVKRAHEAALMRKANVVGVGIGYRYRGGRRTEDVVLVVMVEQKVPRERLAPEDLVPAEIDGVSVDIQAVGQIRAE